jgi:hypothetical protein
MCINKTAGMESPDEISPKGTFASGAIQKDTEELLR